MVFLLLRLGARGAVTFMVGDLGRRALTLRPGLAFFNFAIPAIEKLSMGVTVGLRAFGILTLLGDDFAVVPRVTRVPFMPVSELIGRRPVLDATT
jgi:hypothetical protein